MRQHCTECTFIAPRMNEEYSKYAPPTMEANTKTCDLCYCYVCDCPAKECSKWSSGTGALSENHCCASDKHNRWVALRKQTSKSRNGGVAGLSSPSGSTSSQSVSPDEERETRLAQAHSDYVRRMQERLDDYGFHNKKGPFAPDDAILKDERPAALLTQCRKCNWHSRLQKSTSTSAIGSGDWCHKCGIVICEDRFGKQQCSSPYKNDKDDILLGERTMPFTIVARDPRDFDEFKDAWTDADKSSSALTYDETEMENDTFRHRLGKRPMLKNVLDCIPIVEKEKMPKSGHVSGSTVSRYGSGDAPAGAEETEGIVLENRNDLLLLQILGRTDGFCDTTGHPIDGDIVANWDKTSRSGVSSCNYYHLFVITP
jgi:hypothetical protein